MLVVQSQNSYGAREPAPCSHSQHGLEAADTGGNAIDSAPGITPCTAALPLGPTATGGRKQSTSTTRADSQTGEPALAPAHACRERHALHRGVASNGAVNHTKIPSNKDPNVKALLRRANSNDSQKVTEVYLPPSVSGAHVRKSFRLKLLGRSSSNRVSGPVSDFPKSVSERESTLVRDTSQPTNKAPSRLKSVLRRSKSAGVVPPSTFDLSVGGARVDRGIVGLGRLNPGTDDAESSQKENSKQFPAAAASSSEAVNIASSVSMMNSRGPRGAVGVMPAELLGRIDSHHGRTSGLLAADPDTMKSHTLEHGGGIGGVDQFHTLQIKKGKSEEDLTSKGSGKMSTSSSNQSSGGNSSSPNKARFRRRASTSANKKLGANSLVISDPMPGSFRKVAGVREDRTDGGAATGGERSRTVDIDLTEDKTQLGFEFELRKWQTLDVHEVRVTGIQPGSLVETQRLLTIGDVLTKVNGVGINKISNRDELQFLMTSEDTLVLTVAHGDTRNSTVSSQQRPATADGFFTTPEPPGGGRSDDSAAPASQIGNPLRMDAVEKFIPPEIDPDSMECAYDAIELYPEKPDPKKAGGRGGADPTGEGALVEKQPSKRDSVGLAEYMDNVIDIYFSKDLSGSERRQQLAKHVGTDLNLPSLEEEEEEEEKAPLPAVRTFGQHAHSSRAAVATSDDCQERGATQPAPLTPNGLGASPHHAMSDENPEDDDGIGMDRSDAGSDSLLGDSETTSSLAADAASSDAEEQNNGLYGLLHATVNDGGGFLMPCTIRCVLSADDGAKQETARAAVTEDGRIAWDECFEMELCGAKSLVVSCFASTGSHRDALSGRTSVQLDALFRTAGTRRLQLTLAPRGSVRIDLEFTERVRLLKRFPSDDQYFGVFGVDLVELVSRERRSVPHVAEECLAEITARGMNKPGLYQVAGSFRVKEAVRDSFETDSTAVSLAEDCVPDISIVAALLKDYLRELPEPLLTNALCGQLVRAARQAKSDELRRQHLFDILQHLPAAYLNLARVLFRHFQALLANSAANKVSLQGLSTCVGPILLCPAPHARGSMEESVDFEGMAAVVECMIQFGWPDTAFTNEATDF